MPTTETIGAAVLVNFGDHTDAHCPRFDTTADADAFALALGSHTPNVKATVMPIVRLTD
jgi:hypothetical protein